MNGVEPMLKVVLTGGAFSGKTTMIRHFARAGFHTVPEAALAVIERLNRALGVEQQRDWRNAHLLEFQRMIVALQLEREQAVPGDVRGPVFFDRGLMDGLGYLGEAGIAPPAELVEACKKARYDRVFLLQTLSGFNPRSESGRPDTLEYSYAIATAVRRAYLEHGHEVIEVPEMPVDQRAAHILERLP
ncbi:MAG TPA: ATP-binding protein [Candidatus Paceibacterota bacterium]|nr:ATP-binding protein [Candidatus Paceibacterota bacterium]HSA01921.1 ATP-binding protein [Candidatus Paceibacterota bacterium]